MLLLPNFRLMPALARPQTRLRLYRRLSGLSKVADVEMFVTDAR